MTRRHSVKQRHLDCFLAIVRTGSIHGAAQELNLSQPALSRTLADLEDKLGSRVMDRSRTGVTLTQTGEVFLRYASAATATLEQGLEQVEQIQRDDRQVVTIGALPAVQIGLLPYVVAEFMAQNPGVMVRIADGTNKQLLQLLRLGEVDFVVGRLAAPDDMFGLTFDPLYTEELAAVVRDGHPCLEIAGSDRLAEQLSAMTHILPVRGTIIREDAEQLILSTGARISDNVVESVSVSFCRAFVAATDAVWVTVRGVVADEIASGHMVPLPLNATATRGWVGISTRRGYPLSRQAQHFLATLQDQIHANK